MASTSNKWYGQYQQQKIWLVLIVEDMASTSNRRYGQYQQQKIWLVLVVEGMACTSSRRYGQYQKQKIWPVLVVEDKPITSIVEDMASSRSRRCVCRRVTWLLLWILEELLCQPEGNSVLLNSFNQIYFLFEMDFLAISKDNLGN